MKRKLFSTLLAICLVLASFTAGLATEPPETDPPANTPPPSGTALPGEPGEITNLLQLDESAYTGILTFGSKKNEPSAIPLQLKTDVFYNETVLGVTNMRITPLYDPAGVFQPRNDIKSVLPVLGQTYIEMPSRTVFNVYAKTGSDIYENTYQLSFKVEYSYATEAGLFRAEQTFALFMLLDNNRFPAGPVEPPTPTLPPSAPRVMLTGYTIEPAVVMAGEVFTIKMQAKNHSPKSAVENIKITVTPDDSTVSPVNGSNTAFFAKMAAGEEVEQAFSFQTKANSVAAAVNLTIDISYYDANSAALAETASISVPISQPIRIKIDNPVVYAYTMSEPISITMNVYNMGKRTLYNLLAEVSGEGLMPEGSYYGGNLEPGATKTVELSVLPLQMDNGGLEYPDGMDKNPDGMPQPMPRTEIKGDAGAQIVPVRMVSMPVKLLPGTDGNGYWGGTMPTDYYGTITLTYEDENGTEYSEQVPFSATVQGEQEFFPTDPDDIINPEGEPEPEKNLTWLWITLGAVALCGAITAIILVRAKRKKMINDELV